MQESQSIQCPFCGQEFEVLIDTSQPSQRFTTDCEICCRPMEICVACEAGEIMSLDVQAN
ncbi:MAG TPA: CPXCG motif-containing cysteine-rich protein [Candidatus Saccharimonadales bacterium]|nr:CPXCG motif-containing cysteine-rich protein [Candidatus Saccharimonadales bacterium]